MSGLNVCVGIDVSKAQLDVALSPTDDGWHVSDDEVGIILAKTDRLDARGLAHVAEAVRPMPRPLPEAHAQALSAPMTRRR